MESNPRRFTGHPGGSGQRPPRGGQRARSTKIAIAGAGVLLVAILAASLAWTASRQDKQSGGTASATTFSSPVPSTQTALLPFQSAQGITWITAACGSPTLLDDKGSNTLLPRSTDWGICMGTPGAPPVLAGVYEHNSILSDDLAAMNSRYHHAVRTDGTGLSWIFVTEGDVATLAGLNRYGFRID
ncbi:MAG: hypothetical protein HYZ39_17400 [Mycolicibacterium cosmeticum]|nr:hypothetical protein [Mycolicibacterium cosmeticum]